jgi:hypothetical protein
MCLRPYNNNIFMVNFNIVYQTKIVPIRGAVSAVIPCPELVTMSQDCESTERSHPTEKKALLRQWRKYGGGGDSRTVLRIFPPLAQIRRQQEKPGPLLLVYFMSHTQLLPYSANFLAPLFYVVQEFWSRQAHGPGNYFSEFPDVSLGKLSIFLHYFCEVLRIQDVYPGSEFFHPGSRVKNIPYSGALAAK